MSTTTENPNRDIRLYSYSSGQLSKQGRGKTGPRPHIFKSVEECKAHIEMLRNRKFQYQFVITEYFGTYDSTILEVVNC